MKFFCRVIAPPMGLITWSMGRAGRMGVDPKAPDVDRPERKPWPPLEGGPRGVWTAPLSPRAPGALARGLLRARQRKERELTD